MKHLFTLKDWDWAPDRKHIIVTDEKGEQFLSVRRSLEIGKFYVVEIQDVKPSHGPTQIIQWMDQP